MGDVDVIAAALHAQFRAAMLTTWASVTLASAAMMVAQAVAAVLAVRWPAVAPVTLAVTSMGWSAWTVIGYRRARAVYGKDKPDAHGH